MSTDRERCGYGFSAALAADLAVCWALFIAATVLSHVLDWPFGWREWAGFGLWVCACTVVWFTVPSRLARYIERVDARADEEAEQ